MTGVRRRPKAPGGFSRPVQSPRGSILSSGQWEDLDWSNWWMDAWQTDAWRYIHVENIDKKDGRVHRVYPREHKGRRVTLMVKNGELRWKYDATKEEMERWSAAWKTYEATA